MTHDQRFLTDTSTSDSDRHLLARTRLRDMDAFEHLFERYYLPVYRVVYRMLGDEDAASDVTQETFIALYTHPPRLQLDDEEVRAWLYRVALNQGYNALRAARRARARLPALYESLPASSEAVDPEVEALRAEDREQVRAVLATLPERQVKLLLLRQEGLKYAEIASILVVATGSIGALLVRAERAFQLAWNQMNAMSSPPKREPQL
jgi:RNA polymerase sigma-70 factor (ECF subfamily)